MPDQTIGSFKTLPLEELVAGPLIAAAKGQQALVETYLMFLESMFESSGKEGPDKDLLPKVLKMRLTQNVIDQSTGHGEKIPSKIEAPLLGLVPIPALHVKSVDVDFSVEVKNMTTEARTKTTNASVDASAGTGFLGFQFKAQMSGKTASQRENTRSTDQSAKYSFKIRAEKMDPPETLSRLLDLLNESINPLPVGPTTPDRL